MNVLKSVLKHEVFPALGCTEPTAVAYAAGAAGKHLDGETTEVEITVDPGVYKNGYAVIVPNTNGERGNLIAGVLGALIRRPDYEMEILKSVPSETLTRAKMLIREGRARLNCDSSKKRLFIEALVRAEGESARAVIEVTHTNLVRLELNGRELAIPGKFAGNREDADYRMVVGNLGLSDLVDLALSVDADDSAYIQQGIDMNLRMSEAGKELRKVGHYLSELVTRGFRENDLFASCEALTTSAADARMHGLSFPVMSSGGSGNQGIVAILVPHAVGKHYRVAESRVIQSIALSHLVNSYVKCHTGELSPLCGCAIAAGVGAAVAIVFQQAGKDMAKIALAVNNLISDLGGMLCDGAKEGCALKVATATNSAIRAAYMALNGYGIAQQEGFVGATPEQTIRNLSLISRLGMAQTDSAMLGIMIEKTSAGRARE